MANSSEGSMRISDDESIMFGSDSRVSEESDVSAACDDLQSIFRDSESEADSVSENGDSNTDMSSNGDFGGWHGRGRGPGRDGRGERVLALALSAIFASIV